MLEHLVELARSSTGAASAELTITGDPGVRITSGAQPLELGQTWGDSTGLFSAEMGNQLTDCSNWLGSVAILAISGPAGEAGWLAVGAAELDGLTEESLAALELAKLVVEDYLDRTIEQARLHEIGNMLRDSQEQLQTTSAQLMASNAELEQFAYIAAHELVSPLRSVAVYAELLESLTEPGAAPDRSQVSACATQIRTGINTMSQQVRYLMDLSTIQPDTHGAAPVDLNEVVSDALKSLSESLQAADAIVEVASLPVISGRRIPLQSVFANLISNAIRYRTPYRQLSISISAAELENDLRVYVSDNGVGVDVSDSQRIFGLFERASATAAGSGIGLAVSRRIIESLGGSIGVDATQPEGSLFWIDFPKAASHQEQAALQSR